MSIEVCMYMSVVFVMLQFYLASINDHVDPRVKSASIPFQRPVSTGTQSYGTNPDNYPITKPMTKLTALLQVYTTLHVHVQALYGVVCVVPFNMHDKKLSCVFCRRRVRQSTLQTSLLSPGSVLLPLSSPHRYMYGHT